MTVAAWPRPSKHVVEASSKQPCRHHNTATTVKHTAASSSKHLGLRRSIAVVAKAKHRSIATTLRSTASQHRHDNQITSSKHLRSSQAALGIAAAVKARRRSIIEAVGQPSQHRHGCRSTRRHSIIEAFSRPSKHTMAVRSKAPRHHHGRRSMSSQHAL